MIVALALSVLVQGDEALRFHAAPGPLAEHAVVADWPGFLGPRRDGICAETPLALEFSDSGPPLIWERDVGTGFASPALADGRLVFAHRLENTAHVDCLDPETGALLWRHSYASAYRGKYIANSGPRATPEISEGRVYVHGAEGVLHCFDLETGEVLWKRDLIAELGARDDFFGVVSSPLVFDDLLIQNVGAPGGPSVAAFDKQTGETVWQTGTEWGPSCASPVLVTLNERPTLLVMAGGESRPPTGGLMVLHPRTGALDFTYPFRSRTYESANGASPIVDGNRIFLTASYGVGSAVLEVDAEFGFRELWADDDLEIQFSNPIFHDGHVYVVHGLYGRTGAVVCLDPATGKELLREDLQWTETIERDGQERTVNATVGEGSLLWADGHFLALGDGGHLMTLDLAPDGAQLLARAALFRAPETWTPPVISQGLLYVRQNERDRYTDTGPRLLCYDVRGN